MPEAIIVLLSPSRNTELLPMAKMLESSCVTTTMVARRLDDLILDLRDSLRATIVVVTHELSSIFAIGNNSVFLDGESKTMIASGNPRQLLADSKDPRVLAFLTRGEEAGRG